MSEEIKAEDLSIGEQADYAQRLELSRSFVGLVFPRLMSQFAQQVQTNIEAIAAIKNAAKGKGGFGKELSEHQKKLEKILSEDVQNKVIDQMTVLLADVLAVDELQSAILQEIITVKISGVADKLEEVFQQVLKQS